MLPPQFLRLGAFILCVPEYKNYKLVMMCVAINKLCKPKHRMCLINGCVIIDCISEKLVLSFMRCKGSNFCPIYQIFVVKTIAQFVK